jgi:hypothetical protein
VAAAIDNRDRGKPVKTDSFAVSRSPLILLRLRQDSQEKKGNNDEKDYVA